MFESREQKWKEEVTYFTGLPGEFEDEEAIYEEDIPTVTGEQGTGHYDDEDSSDVFIGPIAGGLDYKKTVIKSMENTRNNMLEKPCIPPSHNIH